LTGTNTASSCGGNAVDLQVTVSGGTPPYSSSSSFSANGDVTYTVTDNMGCHATTVVPR